MGCLPPSRLCKISLAGKAVLCPGSLTPVRFYTGVVVCLCLCVFGEVKPDGFKQVAVSSFKPCSCRPFDGAHLTVCTKHLRTSFKKQCSLSQFVLCKVKTFLTLHQECVYHLVCPFKNVLT